MKTKIYFGEVRDEGIGGQEVNVYEHEILSSSSSFDNEHILLHIEKHSPDGFNWGYGGSGPADLALSILTDYFGAGSEPVRHYQNFKFKIISGLPQGKSFVLEGEMIDQWWKEFVKNEKAE